jgi:hypothetical protein
MMMYDFSVVFVPGKKNTLPDGLSRFPIQGPSIYEAEEVPVLSVRETHEKDGQRPVHLTVEEAISLFEERGVSIRGDPKNIHELAGCETAPPLRRGKRKRSQPKSLPVKDFRLRPSKKNGKHEVQPDTDPDGVKNGQTEADTDSSSESEEEVSSRPRRHRKPPVLFTSNEFHRRVRKKKKSQLVESEKDSIKVGESSSDDSESTTLDESDSEDSGEEQVPVQSKEQKKKDQEAATRRHMRRVNSKVSLK